MEPKPDTNSYKGMVYKFEPSNNETETIQTNYFLYFTAVTASIMIMAAGISFSWTSPIFPQLDATIGRVSTAKERSWITGFMHIGGVFGPLVAGRVSDKIGRKKALLLTASPMILSFLIAAFAKNVPLFYLARILMGIGTGSAFTVLPIYLVEISENHNRGTVSSLRTIFTSVGVLFSYLFGPFLTIQNFCLACLIPLLTFVIIFWIWVPETPPYLASRGKQVHLQESLKKLRNKNKEDLEEELITITNFSKRVTKKGTIKDLFTTKATRNALWLSIGLMIWQQSAGITAINSYLQTIFEDSGSKFSPQTSPIIVGTIQLVCVFLTMLIMDRIDRRTLLLASSCGGCLSLFLLGMYFYLKTSGFDVDVIFWLPLFSLVVYIISYSIGIFTLPLTIAAELFPLNVKATALTIALLVRSVGSFITGTSFPLLVNSIGMAETFWIFGFVSFAVGAILFWKLPETRGRSLQEIQDLLQQNK